MTSTACSKMSKQQIAVNLIVCYWIATFPLTWFVISHDPSVFLFVWFVIAVFFALPVSAILWVIVLIDRRLALKSRLPNSGMFAVGFILPIIYIVTVYT